MNGYAAPKPANFEALAAAWDDRDAFDRECGVYSAQLVTAGYGPITDYDIQYAWRKSHD